MKSACGACWAEPQAARGKYKQSLVPFHHRPFTFFLLHRGGIRLEKIWSLAFPLIPCRLCVGTVKVDRGAVGASSQISARSYLPRHPMTNNFASFPADRFSPNQFHDAAKPCTRSHRRTRHLRIPGIALLHVGFAAPPNASSLGPARHSHATRWVLARISAYRNSALQKAY
jgi:hypothetical protein